MILGYYYNDLELIESSIECLENALRVFDYDLEIENFIVASINLAYLYVDQNDYNNSLNILYRLLDFKEELKPSELVGVYNIIARNFARKQEFIKTIAPIEKALEILPESKMTEETLEFIEIHAFNYQKEFGVSPFSKNIIF